nr:N-terminal Xaa-Pro-Lys N-methyltransferase 1 [Leptinotarsa decemlineata]
MSVSEDFKETGHDEKCKSNDNFYSHGANYWSVVPATIDGMLGGFGFVSQTDIKGSKLLLKQIFNSKNPPGRQNALDCGAGIGRITKFLLTDMFDKVDMVEQNPVFLEQAKHYLGPKRSKVDSFYSTGLQDFQPASGKYDVIWIQWVLGHLTDEDLIQFLKSCQNGLKLNGVIVVKENITSSDECEMDSQDYSVTRPMHLFQEIFDKAGLDCYRKSKQLHFPRGLYSVYMFALRPKDKINCFTISEDTSKSDSLQ